VRAGDGNRTRMASLEGWVSIESHTGKSTDQSAFLMTSEERIVGVGTPWALRTEGNQVRRKSGRIGVSFLNIVDG
jgi:hypothetical protein